MYIQSFMSLATSKLIKGGPRCACGNLRKAVRAVTQLYDDSLRPTGLRATQLSVLVETSHLEPVTVRKLAAETVTDPTTTTRNLKILEKQGLIRLVPGDDRREKLVSLTPRGRKSIETAFPHWEKAQARVMKVLGQKRFDRLLEDLSAVLAAAK